MTKIWTRYLAGCLLFFLLGTALVFVATAFARVWVVARGLDTADRMTQAGRPGAALAHLDRVGPWARPYAELELRWQCAAARAHALRMDFDRAVAAAECALNAEDAALAARAGICAADRVLTGLVELTRVRTRSAAPRPSPWSGYAAVLRELRRSNQAGAVDGILRCAADKFPGGRLPADICALLQDQAVAPPPRAFPSARVEPARSPESPEAAQVDNFATGTSAVVTSPPQVDTNKATVSKGPDEQPAPPPSGPRWAVVTAAAGHAYQLNGKFYRNLKTGALLTITDVRDTAAGRLAIGRLTDAAGPSLLIPVQELELQSGALADVEPDERALRARRAVLMVEIEKARREAADTIDAAGNPHGAAYQKARSAYMTLQQSARDVQSRWERATGAERMRLSDELRQLKTEDVRLEAALTQAKRAYDEWAAAHPAAAATVAPTSGVGRLEIEIAEIDKRLGDW